MSTLSPATASRIGEPAMNPANTSAPGRSIAAVDGVDLPFVLVVEPLVVARRKPSGQGRRAPLCRWRPQDTPGRPAGSARPGSTRCRRGRPRFPEAGPRGGDPGRRYGPAAHVARHARLVAATSVWRAAPDPSSERVILEYYGSPAGQNRTPAPTLARWGRASAWRKNLKPIGKSTATPNHGPNIGCVLRSAAHRRRSSAGSSARNTT